MITSKELQYVDSWASRIPMPGYEYSIKVLNELRACFNQFNKKYKDKEYNIIFSNGEEIKFQILEKNLCHMLGIDFNNLRGEYFNDYRLNVLGTGSQNLSSYELLQLILEHAEQVARYDNDLSHREKAINYYKSGIKSEIFNKLSDFEQFNFGAINYNPGDGKYDYSSQKNFFVPSNEAVCPYFMMGIKKDEKKDEKGDEKGDEEDNGYIVSTLFAPITPKQFFENQEVLIPTQILVSDNDDLKKMQASPSDKIRLLTMYKSIINEYKIPNKINIYGDYEAMLNELSNSHYVKNI